MWIICDLDGTLCDHTHRVQFARNGHIDEYHRRLVMDVPHYAVRMLIHELHDTGHNISFITGRPDRWRENTMEWLRAHLPLMIGSGKRWELHMRAKGDRRPDVVVKTEIYNREFTKNGRFVWFVLEDRARVVQMWRDMGLTCFSVAEGNY